MKFLKHFIVLSLVIFTACGNFLSVNNSIKAIENLLVSFKTSLSIDAIVCWESGEKNRLHFISQ